MRFAISLLAGAFLLLGVVPNALAIPVTDECTKDADCPQAQVCEVVGGMTSGCAAGEDCVPETTEIFGCVPAPCETNADCSGETVCIFIEAECEDVAVSMAPCPPDEECEPLPEPEPCEPVIEGRCGPKWLAPCDTAADCGAGFKCMPETEEVCEGRTDSATDTADGTDEPTDSDDSDGSAGAPPEGEMRIPREPRCETVETGVNRCFPEVTECFSDADCLEDWTCLKAPMIGGAPVPDCPPDEDCGDSDGFAPPPEEEQKGACVPQDLDDWANVSDFSGNPSDSGRETAANNKGGSEHKSTGGIFGCSGAPASTPWLLFLMLIPFFLIRKVREV